MLIVVVQEALSTSTFEDDVIDRKLFEEERLLNLHDDSSGAPSRKRASSKPKRIKPKTQGGPSVLPWCLIIRQAVPASVQTRSLDAKVARPQLHRNDGAAPPHEGLVSLGAEAVILPYQAWTVLQVLTRSVRGLDGKRQKPAV